MNLTISVDDDILLMARRRALEERTSVNAVLKRHLEEYAGVRRRQAEAVDRLLALSRTGGTGRGDARWSRDDLYER